MAKVTNPNIPTDLQAAFRHLVGLHNVGSSEPKRAQILPSVRAAQQAAAPPVEIAQAAQDAGAWLATQWIGPYGTAAWSTFYAARFNEVMTKNLQAPYWRSLTVEWDKTGISTPAIGLFNGAVNPAYNDPLRQPTECQYHHYDRLYDTPTFPSMGSNKSPGWAGAVDAGHFKDTWHATRILAFSIPTAQQSDTRRPIILNITAEIEGTATIRGNAIWFTISTKARVTGSNWSPTLDDRPITHYKPEWRFARNLPGDSPGGWIHDEEVTVWRYGNWEKQEEQPSAGQIIILEIGTPPSLGRYYARNDSITILHNDTAELWWPQRPGEM